MLFWMLMLMAMLVATLSQALLPGVPLLGNARFPVLLGVVLYYALNHKLWVGIVVAFVAGILQDGLSMVPLGYSAFLFCGVAALAGRYRWLVLSEAAVTAAFFGAVASFLVSLSLFFLLKQSGAIACTGSAGLHRVIGSGILGFVMVPVVFFGLSHLHRALDLAEEEGADVKA